MTTVRGRWYPAAVVLPGEARPWNRCYVIAADDGLHVFRKVSEVADWVSSIIRIDLPANDRVGRRGFDAFTAEGLVVVTVGSGCRCGTMGRWPGPIWSQIERARP